MNKRLVLELANHYIYYVKNNDTKYLINIPKRFKSANICIDLKSKMNNYNLDNNNEKAVMENIKTTYSFIDNYNITLVLPILNNELHDGLEKIDTSKYHAIEAILANVINGAYNDLKVEGIQIDAKITLVNNERYKSFIIWFTTRYHDRITANSLMNIIRTYNVNATSYKKYETPLINFVVGSYTNEIDAPVITPAEPIIKEAPKKYVPQTSSGFTTYWLLVAITILTSSIVAVISFFLKK